MNHENVVLMGNGWVSLTMLVNKMAESYFNSKSEKKKKKKNLHCLAKRIVWLDLYSSLNPNSNTFSLFVLGRTVYDLHEKNVCIVASIFNKHSCFHTMFFIGLKTFIDNFTDFEYTLSFWYTIINMQFDRKYYNPIKQWSKLLK